MSSSVQTLLEIFRRLTPDEQREAAVLILQGMTQRESPPLDDEALAQLADETFRDYDAREATRDEG